MGRARLLLLSSLAMLAFAGNSLLCRLALGGAGMDAASFTCIRLAAGAVTLAALARGRSGGPGASGSWVSAGALFAYAACFSLAYRSLPAATGALLLFSAVQATMLLQGFRSGERLTPRQGMGLALALAGFALLLLPGWSAPPPASAALMLGAGVAWGVYSLRGQGARAPVRVTADNFLRAAPMAALWLLWRLREGAPELDGWPFAVLSGAAASGLGYALWYAALPALKATQAAAVQLSVPALTALGGVVFLDEGVSVRFLGSAAAILGGIALVLLAGGAKRV